VFLPQTAPDGYAEKTGTALLLRPREFLANAQDLVTLKAEVAEQAPRYAAIEAPITIITGDIDKTVSTNIHSRPLAATAPNVKLIVLPGVGHMVQNAVPDLVISEVEAMIGGLVQNTAAAAN
jgi:pimeloyl-ACP methyl ester carboxylesterase